jgi:hypothetical protein
MAINLAATWNPRGELERLLRLLPQLQRTYSSIVITLPPNCQDELLHTLEELPQVHPYKNPDWSWGRYLALQQATRRPAECIHYADLDRLLRWIETRPQEWQEKLQEMQSCDYLLMGRTAAAYQSHPQALIQSEALSNRVISHLVGQAVDVSAGSKGFSRKAAEYLCTHGKPGKALGTDGEWTVLLHRAGFSISYCEVDGLDWESADRFRRDAASQADQHAVAAAYDADPAHWAYRVQVAQEIITCGFDALTRPREE